MVKDKQNVARLYGYIPQGEGNILNKASCPVTNTPCDCPRRGVLTAGQVVAPKEYTRNRLITRDIQESLKKSDDPETIAAARRTLNEIAEGIGCPRRCTLH